MINEEIDAFKVSVSFYLVLKLENDLADFKAILKTVVLDMGYENVDAIADSLINGNGHFPSYDKKEEI
jgi:hypothetical protein